MEEDNQKLIPFLDSIYTEGDSVRQVNLKKYESFIETYRGEIWKRGMNKPRVRLVANHLKEIIIRKTALMTDVAPQIEILPTPNNDDMFASGEVLKNVIESLYEQNSWSMTHEEIIYFNQLAGCVYTDIGWDKNLEWGEGDISLIAGDPREYIIDPYVTRAHKINDAEYIIHEYTKPTAELRSQYPDKGILSDYDVQEAQRKGSFQKALSAFGFKTKDNIRPAVDRSLVKVYWLKDRSDEDEEYEEEGVSKSRKKRRFPTGRFIKRVGNTILEDMQNPYWDGRYPVDMMDWQFDPDSPFGISEVQDLASPFKAYNKLIALIIENVILNVSPLWISETDGLAPSEREKLLRNKPGQLILLRPGKKLVRESAPALSSGVLESAQYLRMILDDISGMNEASGRTKKGVTAAAALESLTLQAQSMIRYQARRLESLMSRMGQKMIARVFQYYTNDRLIYLLGDNQKLKSFMFERQKLLEPLIKYYKTNKELSNIAQDDINIYVAKKAFRNFRFHIVAGSSLAMTKVQRAQLAMALYKMGIFDDQAVCETLEVANWKAILERKKQKADTTPKPTTHTKVPELQHGRGPHKTLGG